MITHEPERISVSHWGMFPATLYICESTLNGYEFYERKLMDATMELFSTSSTPVLDCLMKDISK